METIENIRLEYDRKKEENRNRNLRLAAAGVLFTDIDQAWIGADVEIGKGSHIGPGVTIEGRTRIGAGCDIGQHSRIVSAEIEDGVSILQSVVLESKVGQGTTIGPFAYLRPGNRIGRNVRIGDYVEVKNAVVGDDTKISHLTYVGDADLGRNINLGCGVVFVNYDGNKKHRSSVGDDAFIGCNVNLISPVHVEAGAYIAAGTTVTRDVPAGSLSVGRAKEQVIEGWVERRGLLKGRE